MYVRAGGAVDQEPYKRIVAECSGQWGALYAAILRLAYECFRAKALGHPPPPTTPHVSLSVHVYVRVHV